MPARVDYEQMLSQSEKLYVEAEEILSKSVDTELSAEDKGRVEKLLKTADNIAQRAIDLNDLNAKREMAIEQFGGGAPVSQPGDDPESKNRQPNKPFKTWGNFLTAVQAATVSYGRVQHAGLKKFSDAAEPDDLKDMVGSTGTGGGYLIPPEFMPDLMAVAAEQGIVRSRATVIPMRRRQTLIPVLDQTTVLGTGLPNWFGGLRAYWADEAQTKTESQAAFRQIVLTAHKLIMFTQASDELLDDSAISLAAFLSGSLGFAGAIQWMEDFAFIQGNGVNKPLGFVNAPGTLGQARASGGAVAYADLVNMISKLLPGQQAVWVISQSVMPSLLQLSGPAGNPSYIWGSAVVGAPATLLGFPVIWSEKSPILGAKGDVSLCVFPYYLVGDRQSTTVESTKFGPGWQDDLTSWRAVHRVDGRPWLNAPLTYQDGTTQVAPFVVLNA